MAEIRSLSQRQAKIFLFVVLVAGAMGCASNNDGNDFTSGNVEADQRGSALVSKDKKKSSDRSKDVTEEKTTLYDRLGGEERIRLIVDDFVTRVLEDPRVNWTRQGVSKSGLSLRRRSVEWSATPENVARLKKHLVQFICVAGGGPAKYDGKPIKPTHAGMRITEPEFDAAIGDLKATLDKLDVPADVQKDLLAIFQSTRLEIAQKR